MASRRRPAFVPRPRNLAVGVRQVLRGSSIVPAEEGAATYALTGPLLFCYPETGLLISTRKREWGAIQAALANRRSAPHRGRRCKGRHRRPLPRYRATPDSGTRSPAIRRSPCAATIARSARRPLSRDKPCPKSPRGLILNSKGPLSNPTPATQPWRREHPAHRTGRADFPHPALGQGLTPSPTAQCAPARPGVPGQSGHTGAGVDRSRPAVS
jgi:hypothetical protein